MANIMKLILMSITTTTELILIVTIYSVYNYNSINIECDDGIHNVENSYDVSKNKIYKNTRHPNKMSYKKIIKCIILFLIDVLERESND